MWWYENLIKDSDTFKLDLYCMGGLYCAEGRQYDTPLLGCTSVCVHWGQYWAALTQQLWWIPSPKVYTLAARVCSCPAVSLHILNICWATQVRANTWHVPPATLLHVNVPKNGVKLTLWLLLANSSCIWRHVVLLCLAHIFFQIDQGNIDSSVYSSINIHCPIIHSFTPVTYQYISTFMCMLDDSIWTQFNTAWYKD